nr:MAG TPA: hypothetical protein [Caudoviricetes sp.]
MRYTYFGFLVSAKLDLSVLFLIFFNAITDQDQNLTVGRTTFVVSNNVKFIKHLLFNADGYTFDSHKTNSFQIYYDFILDLFCGIMFEMDINCI